MRQVRQDEWYRSPKSKNIEWRKEEIVNRLRKGEIKKWRVETLLMRAVYTSDDEGHASLMGHTLYVQASKLPCHYQMCRPPSWSSFLPFFFKPPQRYVSHLTARWLESGNNFRSDPYQGSFLYKNVIISFLICPHFASLLKCRRSFSFLEWSV